MRIDWKKEYCRFLRKEFYHGGFPSTNPLFTFFLGSDRSHTYTPGVKSILSVQSTNLIAAIFTTLTALATIAIIASNIYLEFEEHLSKFNLHLLLNEPDFLFEYGCIILIIIAFTVYLVSSNSYDPRFIDHFGNNPDNFLPFLEKHVLPIMKTKPDVRTSLENYAYIINETARLKKLLEEEDFSIRLADNDNINQIVDDLQKQLFIQPS